MTIEEKEYDLLIILSINGSKRYESINGWDIKKALTRIAPSDYGFLFERRKKTLDKDAKCGTIDVGIEKLKSSGVYYVGCYVETLEDMLVKPHKNKFLIEQMRDWGIDKVVRVINADMIFRLKDNDVVLE